MVWPHQPEFPYRRRVVVGMCLASALIASAMPDLSIMERVGVVAFVPLFLGIGYLFGRFVPKLFDVFSRSIAVAYGMFMFYGMLCAAVLGILTIPLMLNDPSVAPFERAYVVASFPSALGMCAGVAETFRRWSDGAA